jgi:hypothetical protein
MKNFPFSETRVKRECRDNPLLAAFLQEKNTPELTGRRDIVSPRPCLFCRSKLTDSQSSFLARFLGYLESSYFLRQSTDILPTITLIMRRSQPSGLYWKQRSSQLK